MAIQSFPTKGPYLSKSESPSLYDVIYQDNVQKASTDGGYEHRRRKFTRTPRRVISTGFLDLSHDEFILLENFFLFHQMDKEFYYTDYMMGVTRTMRFDEFNPSSKTIGTNRRWDVKIKMSEL